MIIIFIKISYPTNLKRKGKVEVFLSTNGYLIKTNCRSKEDNSTKKRQLFLENKIYLIKICTMLSIHLCNLPGSSLIPLNGGIRETTKTWNSFPNASRELNCFPSFM